MQVLVLLCCVCVVCSMKLPDGKSAVISDTNNVTQELVKSVISEGIQNNGKVPENCEQDCVTDEDKFEARGKCPYFYYDFQLYRFENFLIKFSVRYTTILIKKQTYTNDLFIR